MSKSRGKPPSAKRGLGRKIALFLLLGGLLFLAERAWRDPEPTYFIHVGPQEIATLEQGWEKRGGRTPEPDVMESLIRSHIDDELLVAQARNLGWHRNDAIIQRRLVQNQRFLLDEDEEEEISDAALLARAYEQGMDESDIVVRRRLLERMRLLIASAARNPAPTDSELQVYLDEHPDRFTRPERTRLTQVYLSRDTHGDSLEQEAQDLLTRLREEAVTPEQAGPYGDPFLIARDLPLSSEAGLARQLGSNFAAEAMTAPLGQWSEPIASSYGLHLVWPHDRTAAMLPPVSEVQSRVQGELMREREEKAMKAHLESLRQDAQIEIIRP